MADVPMRDETLSSSSSRWGHAFAMGSGPPLHVHPTTFFFFFFTFWVMWASGPAALTASHTLSPTRTVSFYWSPQLTGYQIKMFFALPPRWEALGARILWSSSYLFENYHLQAQLYRSEGAFEGVTRAWRGNYAMIGVYKGSVLVFVHLQCFKHPDFFGTNVVFLIWTYVRF